MPLLRPSVTRSPVRRFAGWPGLRLASTVLTCALLLAAGFSAACRGNDNATLSDLNGIEELETRFNRDAGKPRIVLLLSPT